MMALDRVLRQALWLSTTLHLYRNNAIEAHAENEIPFAPTSAPNLCQLTLSLASM